EHHAGAQVAQVVGGERDPGETSVPFHGGPDIVAAEAIALATAHGAAPSVVVADEKRTVAVVALLEIRTDGDQGLHVEEDDALLGAFAGNDRFASPSVLH